jgi:hypothetical protein
VLEEASQALEDHPEVDASEVEVSCSQGEIVLKGTVPERRMKRLAEECVEDLPGVRDVRNEIRVSQQGEQRGEAQTAGASGSRSGTGGGRGGSSSASRSESQ